MNDKTAAKGFGESSKRTAGDEGRRQRFRNRFKTALPGLFWRLRHIHYALQVLRRLNGTFPRECNICGYRGLFGAAGWVPRLDCECKQCHSLERSRLLKHWFDRHPGLLEKSRVLHFAPEPGLRDWLQSISQQYRSADFIYGRADLVLNIEAIDLPDESVDVVICSHVIDYVDEGRAMRELMRILRPGGVALIMMAIIEGWSSTYFDPNVKTPDEHLLHYGVAGRLRLYGANVRDVIRRYGFALDEYTACEPEVSRYGIGRGEKIFAAYKPTSAPAPER
ncbi:MAG TPA: class I SAM-dependent methyltransferase [Dongiaceae bacterium]|jgi:SAM-dependent methyltransferase|nr:class I SAM-dependent methyltransferase [Dongiaceae bacterium]